MATGWTKNGSNWNYYDSNGKKQTGWVQDKGKWYYLDGKGNMQTGWVKSGGQWYYMNSKGDMRKGWLKDGNKWYYLGDDGSMQTGAQTIDGKVYNFNNSGAMDYEEKDFAYNDPNGYEKKYLSADKKLTDITNNKGKYGWQDVHTVDDLLAQIMSQDKFSYDPQQDQLFQMYKKQYNAEGTRAMQNQMGVGAALSGGYNSSAAQTSAQMTYQGYLNQLNDKVADTYQNALNMWKYNKEQMQNRYNAQLDMIKTGNDAYYSQLGAAQTAASNAYNIFNDERNNAYNMWSDRRNYMAGRADANVAQQNWMKEYNQGVKQFNETNKLNKKIYTG